VAHSYISYITRSARLWTSKLTFTYRQFSNFALALGYGLPATLITGILGPYFLMNDPNAKSKVIGIILLEIYWLVTCGLLVGGLLIQYS
jgi:hypothetical protein